MTPEQAKALFQFLHTWLTQEGQTTRKVLAAVPNANLDYCPDAKSTKGIALAAHIATSELAFLDGILKGAFSFESAPTLQTPGDVVDYYDKQVAPAQAALTQLTPEQLAEPIAFFGFTLPRVEFLQWAIVHGVHHRGQLSAYLRAMGGKVPSIYGGSADEPFQMPEQGASA